MCLKEGEGREREESHWLRGCSENYCDITLGIKAGNWKVLAMGDVKAK